MKVNTPETANLRSVPMVAVGNIITALELCTTVTVLDKIHAPWFRVEAQTASGLKTGYVNSILLRALVSPGDANFRRERLLNSAVEEWLFFKKGDGKEFNSPFTERVGTFWSEIGLPHNGDDRNQPWSAAFISHCAREAGFSDFTFSSAHRDYINQGFKDREANNTGAPFWCFNFDEKRPKLGDLICRWRGSRTKFSQLPKEGFPAHCDIVVSTSPSAVFAIGGNLDQSVRLVKFPVTNQGILKPQDTLFAVLSNNR